MTFGNAWADRLYLALGSVRLIEQETAITPIPLHRINELESRLSCRLHPSLLVTYAARWSVLDESEDLELDKVEPLTMQARAAGCPKELTVVGKAAGGPGPEWYCTLRNSNLDQPLRIYFFDPANAEKRWDTMLFIELLEHQLGTIREYRAKNPDYENTAELVPTPVQLADLKEKLGKAILSQTSEQVCHTKFGMGRVLERSGAGETQKVKVQFKDGVRTLLARFLTRIEGG